MSNKIEAFKNLITFVSSSHMGLKGGIKAQRDLISATAEELRIFLQGYKGKHISAEELQGFYKENFPLLELKIKNEIAGGNACAIASANVADNLSKFNGFEIQIHSKSVMDVIKSLLHIKNNKKDFFVDSVFVNTMIHEGTHILQFYLKANEIVFKKSLYKKCKKDLPFCKSILDYKFRCAERINRPYPFPIYLPKNWGESLMQDLSMSHNKDTIIDSLKYGIRVVQHEQEAYAVALKESIKFKFPLITKSKIGDKLMSLFYDITHTKDNYLRLDDKLKIMRKEYSKLIAEERKNIQNC